MPRTDPATKAFFDEVIPDDPRVRVRPMFGNHAAFVGETMFAGVFGEDVFLRLPEAERQELVERDGATPFEPMAGRPMREYVTAPAAWRDDPATARAWLDRSLAWAATLPAKPPKARKR
jgi:TfoX/Sxy family transcriptional regulator of competence genes